MNGSYVSFIEVTTARRLNHLICCRCASSAQRNYAMRCEYSYPAMHAGLQ
jgi:hypothetical protein